MTNKHATIDGKPVALGAIADVAPTTQIADVRARTGASEVILGDGSSLLVRAPERQILRNIGQLLTCPGEEVVDNACVVWRGETIEYAGPASAVPAGPYAREWEADGKLVTPGLIDCHTHALFCGERSNEFAARAQGADYQAIAQAGGGIAATHNAITTASDKKLVQETFARVHRLRQRGTTCVEVKSGYGLTPAQEARQVRLLAWLRDVHGVRIEPTMLALHALPPHVSDRDSYVETMCTWLRDEATLLGDTVSSIDMYCDYGAFSAGHAVTLAELAKQLDLRIRAHAGQFADVGAIAALAPYKPLSFDHLEFTDDVALDALAASGAVAVLLPFAGANMRLPVPNITGMRKRNIPLALATDLNPGTSFCESLPQVMWLGVSLYGMTVEEVWAAVTRNAAKALNRDDIGQLRAGLGADFVLWEAENYQEIPYRPTTTVSATFVRGRLCDAPM